MRRQQFAFGLAAVFAGLTALLVVVSLALVEPFVFLLAIPFGVATVLFWYQGSGRLRARVRRQPGRTRRAGRRRGATAGPRADWTRAGGRRRRQRRQRAADPVAPARGEAYRRLGLEPDASEAEIRRAYREKVKEVHPDRGGDEEEFKAVTEAYDRLVG